MIKVGVYMEGRDALETQEGVSRLAHRDPISKLVLTFVAIWMAMIVGAFCVILMEMIA